MNLLEGSQGTCLSADHSLRINACSLHYIDNSDACKDGDLLLMDFGAEYGNYAADCPVHSCERQVHSHGKGICINRCWMFSDLPVP